MRRTLGVLVLVALLLAGCGDEEGSTDAAGSAAGDRPQQVTQVALLTGTAAGGEVASEPTRLPDASAVRAYVGQFRDQSFRDRVMAAAAQAHVPTGRELAAAVVAVGCEVPTAVHGTAADGGVTLRADLPSSDKQCLAPMTTVALVLVP